MQCGEPVRASARKRGSSPKLVLASGSETRRRMFENAGLRFQWETPRIDESAVAEALAREGEKPRNIAMALAELKAMRIGQKFPNALTLGCDQVLEFDGTIVQKACSIDEARSVLKMLRGKSHQLHSSAVAYEGMGPIWRHTSSARLAMRNFSDNFLETYLARQDCRILDSVGCYKVEEEGVRFFSFIKGDWFAIQGLPLLEFLNFLYDRNLLEESAR